MEDNGCQVQQVSEAPFFMSRVSFKLEPRDNVEFGGEMQRGKKKEDIGKLTDWLYHEEAFRSRGKMEQESGNWHRDRGGRKPYHGRAYQHANVSGIIDDEKCPLG